MSLSGIVEQIGVTLRHVRDCDSFHNLVRTPPDMPSTPSGGDHQLHELAVSSRSTWSHAHSGCVHDVDFLQVQAWRLSGQFNFVAHIGEVCVPKFTGQTNSSPVPFVNPCDPGRHCKPPNPLVPRCKRKPTRNACAVAVFRCLNVQLTRKHGAVGCVIRERRPDLPPS